MRIFQSFLDVRVQLMVLALVLGTIASRDSTRGDREGDWEVIFPPHPMTCEVPNCHSCEVILAEYERLGHPLPR